MINTMRGVKSFRKAVKKVDSFPKPRERSTQVWRPKLHDRVQIPNGIGTVIEIEEDMFLIDLDNQLANVWERLSSIRLPK